MVGYQIRQVSEMLGVPRNTLIAWERRYSIVEPARTRSGYRTYSEEQVATLRRVKALVDDGFRVGDACRIIRSQPLAEEPPRAEESGGPASMEEIREVLRQKLLCFDRERSDEIAAGLVMVPFERVMHEVYFPLLHKVGDDWEHGRITVVQEHFVTAWCREKLIVMLHTVRAAPTTAPEVVCATPPGEMHELGLLAFAVRLSIRGFRVTYLGSNVPTDDLVEHVRERKPFAVCLSMVHGRPASELATYARELRRRVPEGVRISLGGRAIADAPPSVEGVTFHWASLPVWMEERGSPLARRQLAGK